MIPTLEERELIFDKKVIRLSPIPYEDEKAILQWLSDPSRGQRFMILDAGDGFFPVHPDQVKERVFQREKWVSSDRRWLKWVAREISW